MAKPNVAFCRNLKRGMRGNDVIAHKRAISRGFPTLYPWWKKGFSLYYGVGFENAVKGAQLVMKLEPTGIINKETHEALEARKRQKHPEDYAFDAYAIHLADQYCQNFVGRSTREKIVDAAWYWYNHRLQTHYSQNRPFPLIKPPQVADYLDCSGFATLTHYAGGASDPNGRGYDGYGYTGTLLSHGHKTTLANLEPGDFIFYGYSSGRPGFSVGDPTHVAVYVGKGMVISNGHYPMGYYHYDYRSDLNCYVHYNI